MTVADRASQLIRVHRKSTLVAVFVLAFLSILVLNNGNQHVRDSTGKVKQVSAIYSPWHLLYSAIDGILNSLDKFVDVSEIY